MTVSFRDCEGSTTGDIHYIGTSLFFTLLNSADPNDSSPFLVDGQLVVPGNLLHDLVFDPVVNQVCVIT